MGKKDEAILGVVKKLKGTKAKSKPLETLPERTKAAPLDKTVRSTLEQHFGAKLNAVRVHVGKEATKASKELGSRAFAHGDNIYFEKPSDAKNLELLAHELTHCLQQAGGRKMPPAKKGKVLVSK